MKPVDERQNELDSLFSVTKSKIGFDLIIESRGGANDGPTKARNSDYQSAVDLLLTRMKAKKMVFQNLEIASGPTLSLSKDKKKLVLDKYVLPLDLSTVGDVVDLRKAIGRAGAAYGQKGGSSSGNYTKRINLQIKWSGAADLSKEEIESLLAKPQSSAIPRSYKMRLLSYYLCRSDERNDHNQRIPPKALAVGTWREVSNLFYEVMSDGRERDVFHNSLEAARRIFDESDLENLAPDYMAIHNAWNEKFDELEQIILSMLKFSTDDSSEIYTDNDDDDEEAKTGTSKRTEGGEIVVVSKKRERCPEARQQAIEIHKTTCQACGFNFGKVYGELGEGFIEVHHVVPLSESGRTETDPRTDLSVLCANCHRMVHRKRGVCMSIDALKKEIEKQSATG